MSGWPPTASADGQGRRADGPREHRVLRPDGPPVVGRVGPDVQLAPGQPVGLTLNAAELHFFGAEGGRRLNADQPSAAAAPSLVACFRTRKTNMDSNSVTGSGRCRLVTPFDDRGAIDEKLPRQHRHLMPRAQPASWSAAAPASSGRCRWRSASRCSGAKARPGAARHRRYRRGPRRGRHHADQAAQEAGCDGGLVLPPYFVKLTDDEIFAHYEALSKAV